jgi:uncharacterized damage-inducible protein DinB
MKRNFINLFEYNDWANSMLLNYMMNLDLPHVKGLKLINHIIASQDIWFERITGNSDYSIELWEENSLRECYVLCKQSTHNWVHFLKRSTEKSLRADLTYLNSQGEEFTSPVYGVINHTLTHSHYHRGQINSYLKADGFEPQKIDLIYFLRS